MGTLLFRSLIILGLFTVSQTAHAADASCAPEVLSPANASMVKKIVKSKDDDHPESVVSAPDHDKITAADYAVLPSQNDGSGYTYDTDDDNGKVLGINFANQGGNSGPNAILATAAKSDGTPSRKFTLAYPGRARQDIHLEILDVVETADSHNMQTNIYMFPRKVIPALNWPESGNTFTVTLPTGEVETFDKNSKAMLSGPISESGPMDLTADRRFRKHAAVSFHGDPKNVYLKNESRSGGDFRNEITTVVQGTKTCSVKTSLLYNTAVGGNDSNGWKPQGNISFKFATDAEFNTFLQTKCHMDFLN